MIASKLEFGIQSTVLDPKQIPIRWCISLVIVYDEITHNALIDFESRCQILLVSTSVSSSLFTSGGGQFSLFIGGIVAGKGVELEVEADAGWTT